MSHIHTHVAFTRLTFCFHAAVSTWSFVATALLLGHIVVNTMAPPPKGTKKYRIYLRKQRARRVGLSVVRFFAVYLQMCISYILSLGPMVLSTSNLLYWNGKLLTHKVTCLHLTSTITHALNFNVHECFHQNFSNMYSIILLYDLILSWHKNLPYIHVVLKKLVRMSLPWSSCEKLRNILRNSKEY